MKKFLLFIIFFVYLWGENAVIQLNWKYQFEFAGFIIAKEKGFYKKRGIDVTLQEVKHNVNIVDFVLNTPNSYGVGDSALVNDIMQNKPIELLMPIFNKSPFVLVSINQNLNSLKDIENKQLTLEQFAIKNPAILAMLKSSGVDIHKLNTKQENFYDNLTKGIYAVYLSNEIYTLEKKHIPYQIFNPQNYGFDFYGNILFTSKKQAIKNPQMTKNIIEATKEGYIYAFNHIDETINIILNKYNTQNFSREKLLYEAKVLKDYLSKTFEFNVEKLNNIQKTYILLGLYNKIVDINNYIFSGFRFTQKEKQFLKTHLIKAITTYSWEPFNLKQNDKLEGIAIDYWKYIKQKANIKSICIIENNWNKVLENIKQKKADITCSTTITSDRKKYAIFSKPYVKFPIVIATRNNVGFVSDISLLKDKIIAVGKNYTAEKLLKKHYPNIKLVEVANTDEALKLVSNGDVYGAVDILPVIAYKINKYEYANLKISGKTPWFFEVRFMIKDDYPELVSIINKIIDNMPQSKKEEIYKKWISVQYQKGYDKKYIYGIIISSVVIIGIFITIVLFLLKNIKQKTVLEVELKTLATIDKLTSIFNRYKIDMALNEQIEIAKRYHRPLSIIFFDIDHFKKINDKYGHKKGDQVLIELAKIVSENIRSSDIFGRWGGEEFLLILPETELEKAILLAEKLRKLIEENDFFDIHVTCSFGVTSVFENDTSDKVMERVDKVLYKSKESGRNKVSYDAGGGRNKVIKLL